MRTHTRHVLMCVGPRCTENGVLSTALFAVLGAQIDARPELRVKRTRTQCMVACKSQAAVMVVYPEGVWYAGSALRDRVLPALLAFALGAALIYGAGFASKVELHNAAHDGRHSAGFPCH